MPHPLVWCPTLAVITVGHHRRGHYATAKGQIRAALAAKPEGPLRVDIVEKDGVQSISTELV